MAREYRAEPPQRSGSNAGGSGGSSAGNRGVLKRALGGGRGGRPQWNGNCHNGSFTRLTAHCKCAADLLHSLAHAHDAEMTLRFEAGCVGVEALTVVSHFHLDALRLKGDSHRDARRTSMRHGIAESFAA